MIICLCHRVSDRDIERAVRQGCDSFDQLQDDTRVATGCGACTDCAHQSFVGACASFSAGAPVIAMPMATPVSARRQRIAAARRQPST